MFSYSRENTNLLLSFAFAEKFHTACVILMAGAHVTDRKSVCTHALCAPVCCYWKVRWREIERQRKDLGTIFWTVAIRNFNHFLYYFFFRLMFLFVLFFFLSFCYSFIFRKLKENALQNCRIVGCKKTKVVMYLINWTIYGLCEYCILWSFTKLVVKKYRFVAENMTCLFVWFY